MVKAAQTRAHTHARKTERVFRLATPQLPATPPCVVASQTHKSTIKHRIVHIRPSSSFSAVVAISAVEVLRAPSHTPHPPPRLGPGTTETPHPPLGGVWEPRDVVRVVGRRRPLMVTACVIALPSPRTALVLSSPAVVAVVARRRRCPSGDDERPTRRRAPFLSLVPCSPADSTLGRGGGRTSTRRSHSGRGLGRRVQY